MRKRDYVYNFIQTKNRCRPSVFCYLSKAISRILCYVIIYLGCVLLRTSGELLLTDFWYVFPNSCFVLAPNKDLAVSFLYFYRTYPCGYRNLSVLASLFAPRTLRWTAVSRYFVISARGGRWCSDFPLQACA